MLAPWHRLMKPALRAWPKRTNLCREPTKPREGSAATKKRSAQVLQSGIGRILPSNRSANLPRPLMAGAFSRQWQRRALSAVSNETWLNVEVTLNSSNRVVCRIASAGTAVHGSIQPNGNSIGIRKRLVCMRVSYVNFVRNTEGETYKERAPTIRLRHTRRAIHGEAQGRSTTAAALSPLCDRSGGDPVRYRGTSGRACAGCLDAGR